MTIFNGMKTRSDLARAMNIPLKTLTYILYVKGINNYYTSFTIDKKDGSQRLICLLYTSPSPRDTERSRMPSSA